MTGKVSFNLAHNRQRGFTYIGVLISIALIGVGLGVAGQYWHQKIMSDKEKHLLFVGIEMKNALESYYAFNPNQSGVAVKQLPKSFDELLLDRRGVNIKRHLRKLYYDPLTASRDWGIIRKGQFIVGVYSKASGKPIKQARFPNGYERFEGAKKYQSWQFVMDAFQDSVSQGTKSGASPTAVNATTSSNQAGLGQTVSGQAGANDVGPNSGSPYTTLKTEVLPLQTLPTLEESGLLKGNKEETQAKETQPKTGEP